MLCSGQIVGQLSHRPHGGGGLFRAAQALRSHGGGAGFELPLLGLALEMDAVCGCGGVYEGEPAPQWVSRLLAGAQALPGAWAAALAQQASVEGGAARGEGGAG